MDDGLVPTNNRAEFYGWLAACVADKLDVVEDAEGRSRPATYSSSPARPTYVVDTVNKWLSGWAKNDYVKKTGSRP
jgi:hypothetical protein